MQTCPGFFLKSLLECPGNLLEICLVKFVDTLNEDRVSFILSAALPSGRFPHRQLSLLWWERIPFAAVSQCRLNPIKWHTVKSAVNSRCIFAFN